MLRLLKSPQGRHSSTPGFFTICSGASHGLPVLRLMIPARSIVWNSHSTAMRFFQTTVVREGAGHESPVLMWCSSQCCGCSLLICLDLCQKPSSIIFNQAIIPVETPGSVDLAPHILEFDIALGHFDVAWPKLWHKNGVFDQILGCSGHFDVALEKWAPIALKTF